MPWQGRACIEKQPLNYKTMIGTIVYIVGVVLCIWCLYDLFTTKKQTDLVIKILVAVLLLATSWIGMAVYYFILRSRLK